MHIISKLKAIIFGFFFALCGGLNGSAKQYIGTLAILMAYRALVIAGLSLLMTIFFCMGLVLFSNAFTSEYDSVFTLVNLMLYTVFPFALKLTFWPNFIVLSVFSYFLNYYGEFHMRFPNLWVLAFAKQVLVTAMLYSTLVAGGFSVFEWKANLSGFIASAIIIRILYRVQGIKIK